MRLSKIKQTHTDIAIFIVHVGYVAAANNVVFVGDCKDSEQWFEVEADDTNNG